MPDENIPGKPSRREVLQLKGYILDELINGALYDFLNLDIEIDFFKETRTYTDQLTILMVCERMLFFGFFFTIFIHKLPVATFISISLPLVIALVCIIFYFMRAKGVKD